MWDGRGWQSPLPGGGVVLVAGGELWTPSRGFRVVHGPALVDDQDLAPAAAFVHYCGNDLRVFVRYSGRQHRRRVLLQVRHARVEQQQQHELQTAAA